MLLFLYVTRRASTQFTRGDTTQIYHSESPESPGHQSPSPKFTLIDHLPALQQCRRATRHPPRGHSGSRSTAAPLHIVVRLIHRRPASRSSTQQRRPGKHPRRVPVPRGKLSHAMTASDRVRPFRLTKPPLSLSKEFLGTEGQAAAAGEQSQGFRLARRNY